MSRPQPQEKPAGTQRTPAPWHREVKIELITRLFGGGAAARTIDPISWLRSAAAKSALRAWWRAGHAHLYETLDALRAQERVLFGSPGEYGPDGKPVGGPGALEVTMVRRTVPTAQPYAANAADPLNVAYFPAAGMGQAPAHLGLPQATSATLGLRRRSEADQIQQIQKEILQALRLWLVLGGAGSRTRRGAGALALSNPAAARELGVPATLDELKAFLRTCCQPAAVPAALAGVFSLARTRHVYLGPPVRDAELAQTKLLSALKTARQERRDKGRSHQSDWPEGDAIRHKTGIHTAHPPRPGTADLYPRAVLGLPIVMHFNAHPPADPPEHQILGALPGANGAWEKLERYSSPILLRPVRIFRGKDASYVPVAVFTDCTLPSSARPYVVTDPRAPMDPRHVVPSYALQAHADAVLRRIENVFSTQGFQAL
jgi:CRISPR-associated protein Cmr1